MVEVFKTSVIDQLTAKKLIELIHLNFAHFQVNFDLEDCDKILRIKSPQDDVCAKTIIGLLNLNGFNAEVLPD